MSYPHHGQYPESFSGSSTPHSYPWEPEQNIQQQPYPVEETQPPPNDIIPSPVQYQSNATIHLEEVPPERIVPSHGPKGQPFAHRAMILASHEASLEIEHPSMGAKPRARVDTTRPSTSPSTSSLVARHSPASNYPPTRFHPYARSQSVAGTVVNPPAPRSRRESEPQQLRFADQVSPSIPASIAPSPASVSSRNVIYASPAQGFSSPTILASALPISRPRTEAPLRQYRIRADMGYDPVSKLFTAMLELPGSKHGDLSITLSTCVWNRVRQVVVSGRSTPTLLEGISARERRFGEFTRSFVVSEDTRPEDVSAKLEDGILTLSIACGESAESDDAHEIPIR